MTKQQKRIDPLYEPKNVAGKPQDSPCVLPPNHERFRERIGKRIRNRHDADDAMQDFSLHMVAALRSPGVIEDMEKYQGTSANHVVCDYYRQQKAGRREVSLDAAPEPASEECRPEEVIAREEARLLEEKRGQLIRDSLLTLPLLELQAFLCRYYWYYSYAQIAEKLRLSAKNAVGVLLQAARRHIRTYVVAHLHDSP